MILILSMATITAIIMAWCLRGLLDSPSAAETADLAQRDHLLRKRVQEALRESEALLG